jgi:hypothetical protein
MTSVDKVLDIPKTPEKTQIFECYTRYRLAISSKALAADNKILRKHFLPVMNLFRPENEILEVINTFQEKFTYNLRSLTFCRCSSKCSFFTLGLSDLLSK